MICIVLIAAPAGLRGHLTRWMMEIAPGVYVGKASKRVKDAVWQKLVERIGDGQAVLLEPAQNEQGWSARTAGSDRYLPIDFDGLIMFAKTTSTASDTAWLSEDPASPTPS